MKSKTMLYADFKTICMEFISENYEEVGKDSLKIMDLCNNLLDKELENDRENRSK